MDKMKSFPDKEQDVNSALPLTVKVTKIVQGVAPSSSAESSSQSPTKMATKRMPIDIVNIPEGTIMTLEVDMKNPSRIITDFKASNGRTVYTTPKQLIGNVQVVNKEETDVQEDVTSLVPTESKSTLFTTKNIMIGVGVLIGGYLFYKYVLKSNN